MLKELIFHEHYVIVRSITFLLFVWHCFCLYLWVMNKSLSIFFITLNLFGNTELGQMLKLPQLFAHFKEHRKINSHLNVAQFLSMHYAGDNNAASDDNEDKKLPCHDPNQTCLSFILAFTPYFEPGINNMEYADGVSYGSRLLIHKSSEHFTNILKPPRIARMNCATS